MGIVQVTPDLGRKGQAFQPRWSSQLSGKDKDKKVPAKSQRAKLNLKIALGTRFSSHS